MPHIDFIDEWRNSRALSTSVFVVVSNHFVHAKWQHKGHCVRKNWILIYLLRTLVCDILWFMNIEPYSTHTLLCHDERFVFCRSRRAWAFKSEIKSSKYGTRISIFEERGEKNPLDPTLNYDSLIFYIHRQASSNMLQLVRHLTSL